MSKPEKTPDGGPPFLGTWKTRVRSQCSFYLVAVIFRLLRLHAGLSMRAADWIVLVPSLISIIAYGLYRARGSNTVDRYLLAGRTMPWYAMALSIMATQASAITFISTTGQSYIDGMRFVQFYFGLPIAMVIICATAVPVFHRARVYTAYEFLEKRFDGKTRALASLIFLAQRGVSAGLTIYACRSHRALGDLGMAGTHHHADHGSDRGQLHSAGRNQGSDMVRRAADVRDLSRAGGIADHGDCAAAAIHLVRRRGVSDRRGGSASTR